MRKPFLIILFALLVLGVSVFGFSKTALGPKSPESKKVNQTTQNPPGFDKKKYPIGDPTSPWVIVNKNRALDPIAYTPTDLVVPNIPLRSSRTSEEMKLRAEAAAALERMTAAAKKQGAQLKLASGYRSYNTQVSVYGNEVKQYGQKQADSESARPGRSEHQTGLAADLQDANGQCVVADCFKDLTEGKWVAEHAWEYGFILRYLPGKEAVTGYRYEPWHVRYIGTDLATELHKQNITTLEEFFDVVQPQPY